MKRTIVGLLLVALSLPFASPAARAVNSEAHFTRVIDERPNLLVVENVDGPTEVLTWSASKLSVNASRVTGGDDRGLESEISFSHPSSGVLKIAARPKDRALPVKLSVFVPSNLQLSVVGGKGRVTVKGALLSSAVETESGDIMLQVPDSTNATVAVRAPEGSFDLKLPATVFEKDSHSLDATLGQGGNPIILRTRRGRITLEADAAMGRAATAQPPTDASQADTARGSSEFSGSGRMPAPPEPVPPSPAAGEDVIRLEARLVSLNIKVADAGGKTLPSLTKDDFQITDDDVAQVITHFQPVTAPLHIVLLLDLSPSVEGKMKVEKKAAKKFIESLGPTDQIAVVGFARRFFVISNFTTDHKLIKDRIDSIKNHGGTALYDSLWSTLDLFDEVSATRKAIVVLTDGVDNSLERPDSAEFSPKHPFDDLVSRIEEADVTIYPIYLDTEYETLGRHGRGGHDAYVTARKRLQDIADVTGAVLFKADRVEDLEGVYKQVATELHSLYSVGYYPKNMAKDGKWHKVAVNVKRDGVRARTRRGYFAK